MIFSVLMVVAAVAETDAAPCDHAPILAAPRSGLGVPTSSKIALQSWDTTYDRSCWVDDVTVELRVADGDQVQVRPDTEPSLGLTVFTHDGLAPNTMHELTWSPGGPREPILFRTAELPVGAVPDDVAGAVVGARTLRTRTEVTIDLPESEPWWVARVELPGGQQLDFVAELGRMTLPVDPVPDGNEVCVDLHWVGLDGTQGPVTTRCVVPTLASPNDELDFDEDPGCTCSSSSSGAGGLWAVLLGVWVLLRERRR